MFGKETQYNEEKLLQDFNELKEAYKFIDKKRPPPNPNNTRFNFVAYPGWLFSPTGTISYDPHLLEFITHKETLQFFLLHEEAHLCFPLNTRGIRYRLKSYFVWTVLMIFSVFIASFIGAILMTCFLIMIVLIKFPISTLYIAQGASFSIFLLLFYWIGKQADLLYCERYKTEYHIDEYLADHYAATKLKSINSSIKPDVVLRSVFTSIDLCKNHNKYVIDNWDHEEIRNRIRHPSHEERIKKIQTAFPE
jgi:hypothetical protein